MKLLVSDYDGTLKTDIKNLKINIEKVNQFMSSGNKFAIATGREFASMKKEIENYNIKYDYLICNNGLITFDSKDNIVSSLPIGNEDLKFICDSLEAREELVDLQLYNCFDLTDKLEDILEVFVKFKTKEDAYKHKICLEYFKKNLNCHQINNLLYIGNNFNKATAIYYLSYLLGIDNNDIYTVGDDINDLEMLEEFNGYKMLNCNKKLLLKPISPVTQVHKLVKKISNK